MYSEELRKLLKEKQVRYKHFHLTGYCTCISNFPKVKDREMYFNDKDQVYIINDTFCKGEKVVIDENGTKWILLYEYFRDRDIDMPAILDAVYVKENDLDKLDIKELKEKFKKYIKV